MCRPWTWTTPPTAQGRRGTVCAPAGARGRRGSSTRRRKPSSCASSTRCTTCADRCTRTKAPTASHTTASPSATSCAAGAPATPSPPRARNIRAPPPAGCATPAPWFRGPRGRREMRAPRHRRRVRGGWAFYRHVTTLRQWRTRARPPPSGRCRRAVRAGSSTTHQCAECPSEGRCPSRPPPATPCSSCRRSPRCMRVISLPTPPKGSCCSRSPTGCSRSTWPLPPVEHTTSHPAATATAPRAWRWWWRWGPTAPTAALWRARCPTAPCNPAWPRAQKIRGLAFRCCRASGGRCRHGSSTTHSPAPPRADVVTGCPSRKC
eukprot:m.543005 g.543005  ORF g.543005 m.543005 type:complete len:320 (-) comp22123_c0_seq4:169-1128(-)